MHPFLLKLVKRKLQLIQARFMKKYFQVYKKALGSGSARLVSFVIKLTSKEISRA